MATVKRKNVGSQVTERANKQRDQGWQHWPNTESTIFTGIRAFVLPAGMGSGRLALFKAQILKHGGQILDNFDAELANRAVVDDSVNADRVKILLAGSGVGGHPPVKSGQCQCVRASWLSQCLKSNRLLDTERFLVTGVFENNLPAITPTVQRDTDPEDIKDPPRTMAEATSDACGISSQQDDEPKVNFNKPYTINVSKFICASSSEDKNQNFNVQVTEKLQALAATYKNTKDQWRAMGYERAISVLKNYGKPISSREEAKSLPGIGERLADKIWEIVESGRLRKMEEVCNDDRVKALNLFTNIWGVGPSTAQQFVQQGFRTLDDLRDKGILNRQQKIGLQHYDDILERMPREEATIIQMTVREAALSLVPGLEVMACGSYRRGKANCGDVDVLITHPDGRSHCGLLPRILEELHHTGFLTDDLVAHEENGGQHKYLGVCKLLGQNRKHRRLDIIVVPYAEYACSLLYFTGSAHFNRSMRLLARKKGMALSEHSLRADVMRRGTEKISEGRILPTLTEESVFSHLGLTYRPPTERDH